MKSHLEHSSTLERIVLHRSGAKALYEGVVIHQENSQRNPRNSFGGALRGAQSQGTILFYVCDLTTCHRLHNSNVTTNMIDVMNVIPMIE